MKDELDEQIEIEADLQDDGAAVACAHENITITSGPVSDHRFECRAVCTDCGAETWTRNRQKEQ
jgi:hypothetical protein